MEFLNVRELTSSPKEVWKKLASDGEIVITNNGKPTAIMLAVPDGGFEEVLNMIRQVKAMRLLNLMRLEASEKGFLSQEEIEDEIRLARSQMQC